MSALVERVARAIEPETFLLPRINLNKAVYERAFKWARSALAEIERTHVIMEIRHVNMEDTK
jgi:hypothetical protein